MPSTSVSPVWALQETSNSLLVMAKGVLKAATSDNIQPLALLVAEAFGNTLAICTQTQLLVEKEASKRHKSHVLKFLQAQIGYAADDSAFHLSSTTAGVRFLSLTATLLCTSSSFTAAQALESMIKATSREDQLLPTVTQLHDLLKALDYKLARLGFADSIVGWENFLATHPEWPVASRKIELLSQFHPATEELSVLVDAFRTLDRIGDASNIVIKAAACCPWLIAFTKWCLGAPPKVVTEEGTVLLDQPTSKVVLLVERRFSISVKVEVFQNINDPSQLWSGTESRLGSSRWSGMLSIASFGNRRLRELGLDAGHGYKALCQALSHSLKLVKTSLHMSQTQSVESEILQETAPVSFRKPPLPKEYASFVPEAWPSDKDIYSVMASFLSLDAVAAKLPMLQHGDVLHLPYVDAYVKELRKKCPCSSCSGDASQGSMCACTKFTDSVVSTTRDILALSLFDSVEPAFVAVRSLHDPPFLHSLNAAINDIIFGVGIGTCEITEIFDTLLFLLGHKTSQEINASGGGESFWIASAYRGQVVYPTYIENTILNSRNLLRLGGGPGDIEYGGSRHSLVVCRSFGIMASPKFHDTTPVDGPRNLLRSEKLEWQISSCDGYLELGFGITSTTKTFNPMKVLWAASQSLFISTCPHPKDALLADADDYSIFLTPHYDAMSSFIWQRPDNLYSKTVIIAVSGDESLRFFALASGTPAIVRQSACLKCCIHICRSTGYTHVVA